MRHSLLGGTEMFDDKISWLAARCIIFPKHQADNFIIYFFIKHQIASPKDQSNTNKRSFQFIAKLSISKFNININIKILGKD